MEWKAHFSLTVKDKYWKMVTKTRKCDAFEYGVFSVQMVCELTVLSIVKGK